MLSCLEEASEAFDRFFSMLGERVQLKGWDGYRGGLDVKSGCHVMMKRTCA